MDKTMSQLDIAYELIKEEGHIFTFKELWDKVSEIKEFNEDDKTDKVSRFYTNLIIDPRFVSLGDNTWDLRENQTFDKIKLDMNSVYSELEEEANAAFEDDENPLPIKSNDDENEDDNLNEEDSEKEDDID